MDKTKLFTPKDFDKPKDKNFFQKNKISIIIGAVLALIIVTVLSLIFCGKPEQKEVALVEQEQIEQVADDSESIVFSSKTNGIEKVTQVDTQDNANEETEINTVYDKKDLKTEVEQEVTVLNPPTKPTKVSDNVEQEAINVIRGEYGNIPERRVKLGSKYQEIQNRVNQLKKEGFF